MPCTKRLVCDDASHEYDVNCCVFNTTDYIALYCACEACVEIVGRTNNLETCPACGAKLEDKSTEE